jgi:hypothetical protein
MVVVKAPLLEVYLEAETHWLRYGRLVSRALRQRQLRNPWARAQGLMPRPESKARKDTYESGDD